MGQLAADQNGESLLVQARAGVTWLAGREFIGLRPMPVCEERSGRTMIGRGRGAPAIDTLRVSQKKFLPSFRSAFCVAHEINERRRSCRASYARAGGGAFRAVAVARVGSDAFQDWVAQAAAKDGADVSFVDPALEARRRRFVEQRAEHQLLEDAAVFFASRPDSGSEPSALRDRVWRPAEAGAYVYEGRARLRDGGHAQLWRQGAKVVVQQETARSRRDSAALKPGDRVTLGPDGRVRGTGEDQGR